tara:strand:+ start:317 stop:802 length:486 start_codon:yes stop_codon:yes gene_type:complete
MDLSLIPVCDDNGHQLEYKYQSNLYCNICNKKGISNYCIHCDYSRCAKCHNDILEEKRRETFQNAVLNYKKKDKLRKEQNKLNQDGFNYWIAKLSEENEIYYVNRFTNTISYEYPKLFIAPTSSSEEDTKEELSQSEISQTELIPIHTNESRFMKCLKKLF